MRALLFDFDGLIVDTESPALAAWRWVYAQHGQELTLDRWSAAIGTLGGFDAPISWPKRLSPVLATRTGATRASRLPIQLSFRHHL